MWGFKGLTKRNKESYIKNKLSNRPKRIKMMKEDNLSVWQEKDINYCEQASDHLSEKCNQPNNFEFWGVLHNVSAT